MNKIMVTILALRGYDKKKHVEAPEQGDLKTVSKDLKWQGTSQKWRTAVKHGEVWNDTWYDGKPYGGPNGACAMDTEADNYDGQLVPTEVHTGAISRPGDAHPAQRVRDTITGVVGAISRSDVTQSAQLVQYDGSYQTEGMVTPPADEAGHRAAVNAVLPLKDIHCPACSCSTKG